jgi:hypothetical protein
LAASSPHAPDHSARLLTMPIHRLRRRLLPSGRLSPLQGIVHHTACWKRTPTLVVNCCSETRLLTELWIKSVRTGSNCIISFYSFVSLKKNNSHCNLTK